MHNILYFFQVNIKIKLKALEAQQIGTNSLETMMRKASRMKTGENDKGKGNRKAKEEKEIFCRVISLS